MDPFAMLLGMANAEVYKVTTLYLLINAKLATSLCLSNFVGSCQVVV